MEKCNFTVILMDKFQHIFLKIDTLFQGNFHLNLYVFEDIITFNKNITQKQ